MKLRTRELGRVQLHAADVLAAEPAAGLAFDPERDITPEDRRKLLDLLIEARERGNPSDVVDYLAVLKLLSSAEADSITLTDVECRKLKENIKAYERMIAPVQIDIFPTAPTRFAILADPSLRAMVELDNMHSSLTSLLNPDAWKQEQDKVVGPARSAYQLAIVFPKRRAGIVLPDGFLKTLRTEIINRQSAHDPDNAIDHDLVIYAKVLFPDVDLDLAGLIERMTKQQLKELGAARRQADWKGDFLRKLLTILLMTADKVFMSPAGQLQISKPTKSALLGKVNLPPRSNM